MIISPLGVNEASPFSLFVPIGISTLRLKLYLDSVLSVLFSSASEPRAFFFIFVDKSTDFLEIRLLPMYTDTSVFLAFRIVGYCRGC